MVRPALAVACFTAITSCLSLPAKPPNPLDKALDPNFVPPKDDYAKAVEAHSGLLYDSFAPPVEDKTNVDKKVVKRHHCHKCRGGYGGYGGYGGGYGGGYVQPAKVVVVPVTIEKGWGGGGGGYGHKNWGGGGGGCGGGCGGGHPGGGGGGYPVGGGGGGGSWSFSQSQASSSSSSGSGNYWGKK